MQCMRCKDDYGKRDNHSMINIHLERGWEINLCNKHQNFKPNKLIVFTEMWWLVHIRYPKTLMQIHNISYRQAKTKMYVRKDWQNSTYYKERIIL